MFSLKMKKPFPTSLVVTLFVLSSNISTAAQSGGANGGGSSKPQASFGYENIQAILQAPEVSELLGLNLEITDVKLKKQNSPVRTYHITADNSNRTGLCVFEVDVKNDHQTVVKDITVSNLKIIKGCNRLETKAHQGDLSLSCNVMATVSQSNIAPMMPYAPAGFVSYGITKVANVEYVQVPNSNFFECTAGCDNPLWKTYKEDAVENLELILPQGAAQNLPFPMPAPFIMNNGKTQWLSINVTSVMKASNGNEKRKHTATKNSLDPNGPMIYAEARTEEVLVPENEALVDQVGKSGKKVITKDESGVEIRCDIMQPGDISKAKTDQIMMQAPASGKISYAEYEKQTGNFLKKLDQPFADDVRVARQVDRKQVAAKLLSYGKRSPLTTALRANASKIRAALKSNPRMTNLEVFELMSKLMGIQPMSPTSINAFVLLPLVI